ncbi:Uncharacterised nucleotidyltransferase [Cohnella sp. OV330]|uniref:nucleotidyltransferase domain-containing protein n=1 Tax=Cohnella sp. OV330 TaxID=1855288 RepID=UPI0008EA244B|nr:nucleotidyltransferase family protein [Cohnella sp. OV330]SFB29936.1 Uncharacterised nucleotidyltransferase [Cohnella sp. OV330]
MSSTSPLQLQGLPIEMRLLLALIGAENKSDSTEIPDALFDETDWNTFVDLAKHHRVDPYLYHRIKNSPDPRIPASVVKYLQAEYRRNTFLMLQLSGEMQVIDNHLSERGIRALFLKGPVLAVDLYDDLSLRTSCDLDLLIPLQNLPQAEELLTSLGYVKDEYIHTVLNDWKWRHHHTAFYHPVKNVKVELHWRFHPSPSGEPDFEDLWNRRRISTISSQPIHYLGREDLFLFLVSHGARHGWSRLRWLLDIRLWLQQPRDADSLIALLRKHGYYHVGGQALVLVSNVFGDPVPGDLAHMADLQRAKRLAQDAVFYMERVVNLHTNPVPEDVDRFHKRHLYALMAFRHKFTFVISFLFPYPEDAETLPLPKALHALYFPLRPFLWAWRKMAGVRQ